MNHRRLTFILATLLTLSMAVPMIYAPSQHPEGFGDPIGVLVNERDDPTLIGPAFSMRAALDNLEKTEDRLGIDLETKSIAELSPREQAMILRSYKRAERLVHEFKLEAGLYAKSKPLDPIEQEAVEYIKLPTIIP